MGSWEKTWLGLNVSLGFIDHLLYRVFKGLDSLADIIHPTLNYLEDLIEPVLNVLKHGVDLVQEVLSRVILLACCRSLGWGISASPRLVQVLVRVVHA